MPPKMVLLFFIALVNECRKTRLILEGFWILLFRHELFQKPNSDPTHKNILIRNPAFLYAHWPIFVRKILRRRIVSTLSRGRSSNMRQGRRLNQATHFFFLHYCPIRFSKYGSGSGFSYLHGRTMIRSEYKDLKKSL